MFRSLQPDKKSEKQCTKGSIHHHVLGQKHNGFTKNVQVRDRISRFLLHLDEPGVELALLRVRVRALDHPELPVGVRKSLQLVFLLFRLFLPRARASEKGEHF